MSPLLLALSLALSPPAWKVEVATQGGLSGRGAGAVQVSSSGEAELVTPAGQRCRVRLAAAELSRLAAAVKRAHPGRWRPRYYLPDNPTGCCDQMVTTLALVRGAGHGEQRTVTGWYDESRQLVAADALAVHDAAMDAAAHQGCGGGR